jgi:hypothetical protein
LLAAAVWLLPLIPAKPMVGPIYNPLDHLMPPPFPLLLIGPGVAMDVLLRKVGWRPDPIQRILPAGTAGVAFFVVFLSTQWLFAEFLLTDLADNWFFRGGGRHWPFFLKIDPSLRGVFWGSADDELNLITAAVALGLSVLAALMGHRLGSWMKRFQR